MLQHDKPKSIHSRNDAPGSQTATVDDPKSRYTPGSRKEAKAEPPALYQCSFQAEPVKWQSASKIDPAPVFHFPFGASQPNTTNKKRQALRVSQRAFKSPFPHFALSKLDVEQLQQLSREFIINSLRQYQTFLEDQQEKINLNLPAIDEKLWRFVRERENLRVHRPHEEQQRNSWTSTVSSDMKSSNP